MLNLPVKLMLCPLNYAGWSQVSHTGLGVSAMNTAKVLRSRGVNAIVRPVKDERDLRDKIKIEQPTHVVINALWLPTNCLAGIVHQMMNIQFAVLVHSNIAF